MSRNKIIPASKTESEQAHVAKAAGVIGGATFLSRILGFVRDAVVAAVFGIGLQADAFFAAFQIPNFMRRLFVEGALNVAFIPVFTELLARKGNEEASRFACSLFYTASAILLCLIIPSIVMAPMLVKLIAPGFEADPYKFMLTVQLTRLMLPFIFFVCLTSLCMGILNSLDHFAAPSLGPMILNITIIASAFLVSPRLDRPVIGLAAGVVIGGILQLALQFPFVWKRINLSYLKQPLSLHPKLKHIALRALPATFGASVFHINMFVAVILASLLAEGSVSCLYYAERLIQFPLGIVSIAASTAALPSLSRKASENDADSVLGLFSFSLRMVLFITLPAMTGLILLREPIISLLFERGAFNAYAVNITSDVLLCYCAGLWAFSSTRILITFFYAVQDIRTPLLTGLFSIGFNIVFGLLLIRPLALKGLALAAVLASAIHLGLLLYMMIRRFGSPGWKEIIRSVSGAALSAVIMGGIVQVMASVLIGSLPGTFPGKIICLCTTIPAGAVVYFLAARWTNPLELDTCLSILMRKAD